MEYHWAHKMSGARSTSGCDKKILACGNKFTTRKIKTNEGE